MRLKRGPFRSERHVFGAVGAPLVLLRFVGKGPVCESLKIDVFQDIIQLHISCPSDKEEEKSSKDEYENEEKEKKDKAPRKMLSRGTVQLFSFRAV